MHTFSYLLKKLMYLAVLGLSCGTWDLRHIVQGLKKTWALYLWAQLPYVLSHSAVSDSLQPHGL